MSWSKEVFAQNLRKYMESRGKTQRDIAEVAGVSDPTVSDWLRAKKYPRIDKIEKLANYFGILKSDLIEEKAPAEPELSEVKQQLIAVVRRLPEEKAEALYQVAKALVPPDQPKTP